MREEEKGLLHSAIQHLFTKRAEIFVLSWKRGLEPLGAIKFQWNNETVDGSKQRMEAEKCP